MYKKVQEYNINAVSLKMFERIDDDRYVVVCSVCVEYKGGKKHGYPVIVPKRTVSLDCDYETAQKIFSGIQKEIFMASGALEHKSNRIDAYNIKQQTR